MSHYLSESRCLNCSFVTIQKKNGQSSILSVTVGWFIDWQTVAKPQRVWAISTFWNRNGEGFHIVDAGEFLALLN